MLAIPPRGDVQKQAERGMREVAALLASQRVAYQRDHGPGRVLAQERARRLRRMRLTPAGHPASMMLARVYFDFHVPTPWYCSDADGNVAYYLVLYLDASGHGRSPQAAWTWPGATTTTVCSTRRRPCSRTGAAGHQRHAEHGRPWRDRPGSEGPGRQAGRARLRSIDFSTTPVLPARARAVYHPARSGASTLENAWITDLQRRGGCCRSAVATGGSQHGGSKPLPFQRETTERV